MNWALGRMDQRGKGTPPNPLARLTSALAHPFPRYCVAPPAPASSTVPWVDTHVIKGRTGGRSLSLFSSIVNFLSPCLYYHHHFSTTNPST